MNFRRLVSAVAALAVAGTMCAGVAVTASAADETVTSLNPIADTYISSSDATTSHADATELKALSGDATALIKFDASSLLGEGITVTDATLTFNIASRAYNSSRWRWESSSIYLYGIYTNWEDTLLYADYSTTGSTTLSGGSEWSSNDSSTSSTGTPPYVEKSFDVTSYVSTDADGVVAFAITTGTAREQAIASMEDTDYAPVLTITTTTDTLYSYEVNAYDENDSVIKTLDSDSASAGSTVSVTGLSEVISDGTTYYQLDSGVKNHTVSFDLTTDGQEEKVTYNADDTIAFYIEGESMTRSDSAASIYEDASYSGGQAYTTTGANRSLYTTVTLEDGIYSVTVGQGARATSGQVPTPYTGAVTIGETSVGSLTGTTSGTLVETFSNVVISAGTYTLMVKVESSAISPVDYIIIRKTGDIPEITDVDVSTTKTITAGTALIGVNGATDTTATGEESVTTYTIKVANYTKSMGLPSLTYAKAVYTDEEGNETTTLQPTEVSTDTPYYYTADGYTYFVIQTIGIDQTASTVGLTNCADYTIK